MQISEIQCLLDTYKTYFDSFKLPFLNELSVSKEYRLNDIWDENAYFLGAEGGNFGIYFILNKQNEIIYIGKASNSHSIGQRLATYFVSDTEDKSKWKSAPTGIMLEPYAPSGIAVIAIEDYEYSWFVPSLEEYLIKTIQRSTNIVGK